MPKYSNEKSFDVYIKRVKWVCRSQLPIEEKLNKIGEIIPDFIHIEKIWAFSTKGFVQILEYLISARDITTKKEDVLAIIEFLLQKEANPNGMPYSDSNTHTPLTLVLTRKIDQELREALVILLLKYGADPYKKGLNYVDAFGWNFLSNIINIQKKAYKNLANLLFLASLDADNSFHHIPKELLDYMIIMAIQPNYPTSFSSQTNSTARTSFFDLLLTKPIMQKLPPESCENQNSQIKKIT